jgi:hypothetical protein
MNYALAYILFVLGFAVLVWVVEILFIFFAVIFKNRTFIKVISSAVIIISYIYQLILSIGAFFWLWSVTNLFVAILVSLFLGGIFYGLMSGVFGAIMRLPMIFLLVWADEKVPE